jgi:hypothetical protein
LADSFIAGKQLQKFAGDAQTTFPELALANTVQPYWPWQAGGDGVQCECIRRRKM